MHKEDGTEGSGGSGTGGGGGDRAEMVEEMPEVFPSISEGYRVETGRMEGHREERKMGRGGLNEGLNEKKNGMRSR